MARLDGSWWKFQRAYDQTAVFSQQIREHLQAATYFLSYEVELDSREYVVRFWIGEQPRAIWAVQLGEIIHDLRSSLDHAVWQLILDNKKRPRPYVTGFPVSDNEVAFLEGRRGRKPGIRVIDGVSDAARALITELQPYKALADGDDPHLTTLFILNKLWNIDKHRMLNLLTLGVGATRLVVSANTEIEIVSRYMGGLLKDGTEIVRYRTADAAPDGGQVNVKMGISYTVLIDEIQGGLSAPLEIDSLMDMGNDVRDILKLLSQFAADRPGRA